MFIMTNIREHKLVFPSPTYTTIKQTQKKKSKILLKLKKKKKTPASNRPSVTSVYIIKKCTIQPVWEQFTQPSVKTHVTRMNSVPQASL